MFQISVGESLSLLPLSQLNKNQFDRDPNKIAPLHTPQHQHNRLSRQRKKILMQRYVCPVTTFRFFA